MEAPFLYKDNTVDQLLVLEKVSANIKVGQEFI